MARRNMYENDPNLLVLPECAYEFAQGQIENLERAGIEPEDR